MPVTVVAGGQFGSEGKGKVAYEFARWRQASVAIRTGGSNSGHTVIDQSSRPRIFRHLPTAAILSDTICVIGPGTYIDIGVLLNEIYDADLPAERLLIDPRAVIIDQRHKDQERAIGLCQRIGSTGSGTGAAVAERVMRNVALRFAECDDRLPKASIQCTRSFLRKRLANGDRVILEGTQGFGLSLLHSDDYPNVTSRDTTAAAFASEAGLSPLDVDQVVLVIRSFPIRVAGNSGRLPYEIDWSTVTKESGCEFRILECTSVTGRVRRVARFQADVVKAAIEVNAPTQIVLNHVDYIDAACQRTNGITDKARRFVEMVEGEIGLSIDYVGCGPSALVNRSSLAYEATGS